MQRKAYVPGTAALLAALLAGCTSGSADKDTTDNANPGTGTTASAVAEPGKYRVLPEACSAVDHDTLDSLLPGIAQIADADQRDKAYEGEATLTYDTDRKVGCRWKVESAAATDHLLVDFERVVSYDTAVSDDSQAEQLYATRETAADLPEPTASTVAAGSEPSSSSTESPSSPSSPPTSSPTSTVSPTGSPSGSPPASGSGSGSGSGSQSSPSASSAANLQPRTLDGLGDEGFLDDQLNGAGSAAGQRTVTVVFRTSNVIVTIEYEEQPTATGTVPDSKEMQDRAQNLAAQLADSLNG
ncbi:DUF3558 domain-containing protein [Streptomyces sp. NPDC005209]|uniref:DUF3558 domain-containing protein n=1 Tax=Streptomyces sp. NPDC005209 TaxID=3156715 RepID=UPI0033AD946D